MRILHINTVCKRGSTGKIVYGLHRHLLQKGHDSVICYGRGNLLNEDNIYKFSSNLGVVFHAMITRIFGLTGFSSNFSTNKLIRIIKNFRPEIVHLHNLHGYYLNIWRLIKYLQKNKTKIVWTFHDDFMFTGMCGYSLECNKWMKSCGKCPRIREYPKSLLMDFSSFQFELKKKTFYALENLTVVTPSQWLAGRVKQSFLKEKNVLTINNGIDVSELFYKRECNDIKQKHNLQNEKVILAVVSNFLDERKGGKYLIQLAEKLRDEKVKIIIIGYNSFTFDIPINIITLKYTKDQVELAKYYSLADVFVITSRCENFPTVCLEALACGTPIVGFDTGGTKETAPGELGYFVEYGDVEQLKFAVMNMLNRSGEELSLKCINYAMNNYSIRHMYNCYFNLYEKGNKDDF